MSCSAPVNPLLLYSFRSGLASQLREDQLEGYVEGPKGSVTEAEGQGGSVKEAEGQWGPVKEA